jgi:hypothetical protein
MCISEPQPALQMLLFDQVSFTRHMASVSQTTSSMPGKPEMLEQMQQLRGVNYKPRSKGIVMVGGGKTVLGNALVGSLIALPASPACVLACFPCTCAVLTTCSL